MTKTIRIGSRGSQLALWQANHIAAALREQGHAVEIEVIRTTGDRMQHPESGAEELAQTPGRITQGQIQGSFPFGKLRVRMTADKDEADGDGAGGGASLYSAEGIFIKEIEEALAAGRIDVAVHSLKDLPTELAAGFMLAAIPVRADARDVWVCEEYWGLHMLPMHGRVGTTSPRRRAQLLALRPDLRFVELRGNIDTRLRKLEQGEADALVLAGAGLDRLGRTEWVHRRFEVDELCPAPGQGALALEVRAEGHGADAAWDAEVCAAVALLDHARTRFCVETERAVLHELGGGCQLPIGVHCAAVPDGEGYVVDAQVVAPDGEQMIALRREVGVGVRACEAGARVAEELKGMGALGLLTD
jgi:hydroxymethylbilane synthase